MRCSICNSEGGYKEYYSAGYDKYICNVCMQDAMDSYYSGLEAKGGTERCPNCEGSGVVWDHLGPYYKLRKELLDVIENGIEDLQEAKEKFYERT